MGNKKALQIATKELNKAKAPSKPKDIIYDPAGQWKFPGQNTRIPSGDITMQGVPYPVYGEPNVGQPQMMYPGQDYAFPGADYVDEYPQMRRGGGIPKYLKLPKNYGRRQYSNNISATNRLFAKNFLFRKEKNKIYDPNAKYAEGGESGCPEGYAFNPRTGECIEWNPDIRESYDQATSFDPVGDVIYMNPNDRPEGMSDEEYAQMYQDQLEHEQLHRLQWKNDELKGESKTPLRMPSTVDNEDFGGDHYYNRRGEEVNYLHDYWKNHHPDEAAFIPDDVIYNYETDPAMYQLPWTVEGEARGYEYATHDGMESLFPKRAYGGVPEYAPGGSAGCPPGSYWNGKECVKVPKGAKVITDPKEYARRKASYADSLDLYNYNKLQKQLENYDDVNVAYQLISLGLSSGLTDQGKKDQNALKKAVDKILKENPNIKLGFHPSIKTKDYTPGYDKYKKHGSWDIYHPDIKPKGTWRGIGYNLDYSNVKPKQPVVLGKKHPKDETAGYIADYEKKYPPIYVSDPNDPRINSYHEDGRQYLYKPVTKKEKTKQPVAFKRVDEPEKKKEEPVKEKIVIDKLPIKPAYIDQPKKDIIDNSNPVPPKIAVKTEPEYSPEYSEEGGPDSVGYHYKDKQKRYIDWNGRSIGFNLPRFRKPGHGGDLIKKGERRYIHLPTIETRTEGWFEADNDNEEYQDGGQYRTRLTPEEEFDFQAFYRTLPDNLQTDDDTYDIRGYWDSEGRPEAFNYDQPTEDDGYYHAYSINQNTGEYLKSPAHDTFQHAVDEDRKIGYRPITNVQGRNIATYNQSIADPEEQSFLRNTEGPANYIETELTDDEIQAYRDGGYIVEDVSIPSLNQYDNGGGIFKRRKKKKQEQVQPEYVEPVEVDDEMYESVTPYTQAPEDFKQGVGNIKEVEVAPGYIDISREYSKKHSKQDYINERKREYLKGTNQGFNKGFGYNMENFPEQVERNFERAYNYKRNSYIVKELGKRKGFSPKRRGEWIDALTPAERNVVANSKYESKLQPSLLDRTVAGLTTLATNKYVTPLLAPIANKVMNEGMLPGLTKKEQREIKDSRLWGIPVGGLESAAILDYPGLLAANAIQAAGNSTYGSDYREAPEVLEDWGNLNFLRPLAGVPAINTEPMAGVTDKAMMALNPLNYTIPYDIAVAAPSIIRGVKNIPRVLKTTGKLLTEETPLRNALSELDKGRASKTILPSAIEELPITNTVTETPKASWTMEDIPGLHIKSTMSEGPISKIIEPKTGLINVEQALGIIGKESRGKEKLELIKQGLGNVIPKKMDYNEFRKVVQQQLIPLERQFVNHASNYGVGRIGYPSSKRSSFEKAIKFSEDEVKNLTKTFEEYKLYSDNPELYRQSLPPEKQALFTDDQLKEIAKGMRDDYEGRLIAAKDNLNKNLTEMDNLPLENQTLVLGNKEGFGKGSSAHGNPEETLAHIHFLVDKETPDIITATQLQSDALQGTNRIMPESKEALEYSIANMENHAINMQNNYDNAIMIDEYTYELPDGQRVDADVYNNMIDDQYKIIEEAKNELRNYDQKSLLDKNHQERFLQEFVAYAAERGDMNKVRLPTSKTASKIQAYTEFKIGPETMEQAKTMSLEDFVELKKQLKHKDTGIKPKDSDIEFIKKMYKDINNKGVTTYYEPEYQTILKKYDEQPKLIKKLFGEEPKIVTDSKGNTWYEFDIPKKYKRGKGEIKAFKYGGSKNTDNGIVTSLSQKEIQDLIAQGYIVEDVD